MSAPAKTYTERELCLAQREAVDATIRELFEHRRIDTRFGTWEGSHAIASRLYPLPKIERPRVRSIKSHEFRVLYGVIESRRTARDGGSTWVLAHCWPPDRELVALWADLYANPTEWVDDDGSEQP